MLKWSLCWPLIGTQSSGGVWLATGRGEVGEELRGAQTSICRQYIVEAAAFWACLGLSGQERVWHDLASAPCPHLAESESELSVSGFLSVTSQSCEEDEGRDTPLLSSLRHPSELRGPTGMSGEGNHGNQSAQYNGVKKHRWDMLQLWCHACLLAQMMEMGQVEAQRHPCWVLSRQPVHYYMQGFI